MEQGKMILAASLLATAAFSPLTTSRAVTFVEPGDAGQTLATATPTGTNATTALDTITGTISGGADADLFVFTITGSTTFSAALSSVAGIDSSLFLFNASGAAVLANDDASGTSLQSTIPATILAAGTYYLGISLSGNEPVNSANQLLFTQGTSTSVRGPAAGVNPTSLFGFNGNTSFAESGDYSIALTGAATAAAVPEPSTWAALALGVGALGFARRRRAVAA